MKGNVQHRISHKKIETSIFRFIPFKSQKKLVKMSRFWVKFKNIIKLHFDSGMNGTLSNMLYSYIVGFVWKKRIFLRFQKIDTTFQSLFIRLSRWWSIKNHVFSKKKKNSLLHVSSSKQFVIDMIGELIKREPRENIQDSRQILRCVYRVPFIPEGRTFTPHPLSILVMLWENTVPFHHSFSCGLN